MPEKLKICVSDRCFFPQSAFMGSEKTVKIARSLGYQQVEFHPTWAVWWEALTKGKLGCQPGDISSFHINWREDRSHFGIGAVKGSFFVPAYRIFPFEPLGTKALQKLEKKYRKPVVVHWPEDFTRFQAPLLELQWPLKMNLLQVEKALQKGKISKACCSTIKGVVIDTGKLSGWLKDQGEKENQVLTRLFSYITEVHFRFGYQHSFVASPEKKKAESIRVLEKLVKMGYRGLVVVEIGWPDPDSVAVLRQEGTKKLHQKIIVLLESLCP